MNELPFQPLGMPASETSLPKDLSKYYLIQNTPRNSTLCPDCVGRILKCPIPCADVTIYERSNSGTYFDSQATPELRYVLDRLIAGRLSSAATRVKLHYGDSETGELWGDVEVGYIGRTGGKIPRPILLFNLRSDGGPMILDGCILKVEHANRKRGGTLFKHPLVK